jgi:molybdenum cofactor biosynthesis protein B
VGHAEHKAAAPSRVTCLVVTVSDTRTQADDTSGLLIQKLLKENGHAVAAYRMVKDDPAQIRDVLESPPPEVKAIILTGGTGISSRDTTYEAVAGLLEKRIEGFGELFRYLSYEAIGSPALLSRATAGTSEGRIIFSLPGSEAAVRLAMEKLILPELGHIVGLLAG